MDAASWQQAKDVIAEALRRTPSDRETFVRSRCTNPELAAEILTLLAGMTGPHELDALDAFGATDGGPLEPPDGDTDDLAPGTRVGPYVIVEPIGRGGMGQVFLGSDPRLRRKVALKCVLRSLADDRNARILHEARAAARVTHPNVATIHDVIEHDNRVFIVMEYVEGESLAARLKRERIPVERVLTIGRQLASALSAAHAKGVIHRDLKPANIQLTPDGGVKVLDFGIANAPRVATSVASTVSTHRAATPEVARAPQPGTPPYMAPEQLLGRSADERSDIYSLGIVLYEMATGRRPFTPTETADLVMAHAKGAPRADRLDRAVPRPLADILARALAFDPKARFQTAAEIRTALEGVEQQLISRRGRLVTWITRAALGIVCAMLGLAAIGFVTTVGFNLTFGLTGPFAVQPISTYFAWGIRAVVGSAFFITLAALLLAALKAVFRILNVLRLIERTAERVRSWAHDMRLRAGLDTPSNVAQAIAAGALIALAAIVWTHRPLILAWQSFISTQAAEVLVPLAPSHVRTRTWYRIELDLLVVGIAYGLAKVIQLRRRTAANEGRASVAMLASLLVVVVLLNEWPYRVFYHSEFERVDYADDVCYITAESTDSSLLFCPAKPPPRNRVVRHDDARLHKLGVIENVFTLFDR